MTRALLVIDVQNVYTAKSSELFCKRAPDTVSKINELIDDFRRSGDSVIYFVDFIIDATGTPGTAHMGQQEIRKAVADFHSAGFSRVNTAKQYLSNELTPRSGRSSRIHAAGLLR
jgi:nicotinamidase-related amidase